MFTQEQKKEAVIELCTRTSAEKDIWEKAAEIIKKTQASTRKTDK